MGGRPKKYTSNAERKKAYRLRKKQEVFGKEVELRAYRQPKVSQKALNKLICSFCWKEVIGGKVGETCQMCWKGEYLMEKIK